jgi:hypothetical protein
MSTRQSGTEKICGELLTTQPGRAEHRRPEPERHDLSSARAHQVKWSWSSSRREGPQAACCDGHASMCEEKAGSLVNVEMPPTSAHRRAGASVGRRLATTAVCGALLLALAATPQGCRADSLSASASVAGDATLASMQEKAKMLQSKYDTRALTLAGCTARETCFARLAKTLRLPC